MLCILHILHVTEEDDFLRKNGSVLFAPGQSKFQSISVTINDDQEMESNERLLLRLSSMDVPPDMLPVFEITIIDNDMGKWSLEHVIVYF